MYMYMHIYKAETVLSAVSYIYIYIYIYMYIYIDAIFMMNFHLLNSNTYFKKFHYFIFRKQ